MSLICLYSQWLCWGLKSGTYGKVWAEILGYYKELISSVNRHSTQISPRVGGCQVEEMRNVLQVSERRAGG